MNKIKFFIVLLLIILTFVKSDYWEYIKGGDLKEWNRQDSRSKVDGEYDIDNTPSNTASSCLVKNPDESSLLLFGGRSYPDYLSEVWQYDIQKKRNSSNRAIVVDNNDFNSDNLPMARWGHSCLNSGNGSFFVFFGIAWDFDSNSDSLDDVWEFSYTTNSFKPIKGHFFSSDHITAYPSDNQYNDNNLPGSRYMHQEWDFDETSMFYSGCHKFKEEYFGDIWEFDKKTKNFRLIWGNDTLNPVSHCGTQNQFDSNVVPRYRRLSATWHYNGLLYMFAGYRTDTSQSESYNDLFIFSLDKKEWKWVTGDCTSNGMTQQYVLVSNDFHESNLPNNLISPSVYKPSADSSITYLFGGCWGTSFYSASSVVWIFNSEINQFKLIDGNPTDDTLDENTLSSVKGSYCRSSGAQVGTELYIFGGTLVQSIYINTLWKYHPTTCYGHSIHDNTSTPCNQGTCEISGLCKCPPSTVGLYCKSDDTLPIYGLILTVGVVVLGICGLICFIIIFYFICSNLFILIKKSHQFDKIKDVERVIIEQEADSVGLSHIKINKALFEIEYNKIKLKKEIGSGGSDTTIFLAEWNGKQVAFKVFKIKFFTNQEYFDEFEKEVSIMSSINHPHLLRFYGVTLQEPRIGIVMEYCENGHIKEYMSYNLDSVNFNDKIRMVTDISHGMEYLHTRNIIHRDLKPNNCLLDKDLTVKIIDFGLSKIITKTTKTTDLTKRIGTSYYMAPEIVLGTKYTERVDLFSFGIMVYEIMSSKFDPFGKVDFNLEIRIATDENYRPNIDNNFKNMCNNQEWLIDIITRCWDVTPKVRPSFNEIREIINNNIKKY